MRTLLAASLAFILLCAAAPGQEPRGTAEDDPLVVRPFTIQYKPVEDVFLVVHQLVSERGTISIEKHTKVITVKDVRQVVDEIAEVIQAYDVPPPMVEITMSLFLGTRGKPGDEGTGDAVFGGIVKELRDALKYTDYQILGTLLVTTPEGESATGTFKDGAYRIELRVERADTERRRVVLDPVVLSRRRQNADGSFRYDRLLQTTIQVADGGEGIQGSAASSDSDTALFLALGARIQK